MSDERIPVVDLREYKGGGAGRDRFVRVLGEGLERFGFVAVTGHGVSPALLDRAYTVARDSFALPDAVKRACETPGNGRQRGYTSFGVEHAKDSPLPDLKEFWHIGRALPPDHPLARSGDVPPNVFPDALPTFGPTFLDLFTALEGFALELLDAVGDYLALPNGFFRDITRDGNSVLRVIHYPDVTGTPAAAPGAIRSAQHEDINLMTVLPASTRPGLELMTREGRWIPVDTPPDVMVCDTGDMMQRFTGGRLRSTTHRVVNPEGSDGGRLSMPFFLHPHPEWVIASMKPGYAPPITARDFLFERLREIGVA